MYLKSKPNKKQCLRLIQTCAAVIFIAYVAYIADFYKAGWDSAMSGGTPEYTDFTSTYAGALLALSEPAENLYRKENMQAAEVLAAKAAYSNQITTEQAELHGFAAWMYPPNFIIFCLPLALFPYLISYVLWLGVTGSLYLYSVRCILPSAWAWPLALAAPPTFMNMMYGQTGFLSAGMIGAGLALLQRSPTMAGILIGLAAVKPHLGLLIPLALIAGGFWWPFVSAAAIVLASIAASIIAFGIEPWFAFIGISLNSVERLAADFYYLEALVTPLGFLRKLGVDFTLTWWVQQAFMLLAALLVLWSWGRKAENDPHFCLRPALLCFATLLASPVIYLYDMALLVPAVAFVIKDMSIRGFKRWEVGLLLLLVGLILPVRSLSIATDLQIGPWISMGLIIHALYRLRSASLGAQNKA